ncbi:ankyrin repeat domain-containing protein [Candidatus Dependentiae bacterium]|nr:ankyrin repeat domain-containing protein [Candidatus Dependentiae bacterium]
MLRLLFLFIFLNMVSPFSFAMKEKYHSEGKEEEPYYAEASKGKEPESMEIVSAKGKKKAKEELSLIEKLPREIRQEIINQTLDPLVDKLKQEEQNFVEKYKKANVLNPVTSAFTVIHQFTVANAPITKIILSNVGPFYIDLTNIYKIINEMLTFRSQLLPISKTFLESKKFIENKIFRSVKELNPTVKNSLIMLAIYFHNLEILSILSAAGANPNAELLSIKAEDWQPKNLFDTAKLFVKPLQYAVKRGSIRMIESLIKGGAIIPNPELDLSENRIDLIRTAAINNRLRVLKFLVEKLQLNPDVLGPRGQTPLVISALQGNKEMVKFLLGKDANANVISSVIIQTTESTFEFTPQQNLITLLQIFIENSYETKEHPEKIPIYVEIIELLKQYGAKE